MRATPVPHPQALSDLQIDSFREDPLLALHHKGFESIKIHKTSLMTKSFFETAKLARILSILVAGLLHLYLQPIVLLHDEISLRTVVEEVQACSLFYEIQHPRMEGDKSASELYGQWEDSHP